LSTEQWVGAYSDGDNELPEIGAYSAMLWIDCDGTDTGDAEGIALCEL